MRGSILRFSIGAIVLLAAVGAPCTLAAMGSTGRVGGNVRDDQGRPVGGIELAFAPADDSGNAARKAKVGPTGDFLVAFFPSGLYRIQTTGPGWFIRSMTYVLRTDAGVEQGRQSGESHPERGLPPFRVVGGHRVELEIVLASSAYREELARKQDLAEASDSLKKAVALFDKGEMEAALREVEEVVSKKSSVGAAHYLRGMILGRLGRLDEAEAALRKAAELSPGDAAVGGALGTVLVQRAERLAKEGREEAARELAGQAVDLLDRALGADPGSLPLLTNRVAALEAAGRREDLVGAYEALAAAKPEDPGPRWKLADLHFGEGRTEDALAALGRIPRTRTEVAPALYNRAAERFNSGRTEEAIRLATLGLEFDPRLPALYRLLARAHLAEGRNAEAVQDLRRFLELAPDDPEAAIEREMLRRLEKGGK